MAGKSAREEIDGLNLLDFAHVPVSSDVGPVGAEDLLAVFIDFDLPRAPHPRPFEAKVDPSDSGE